MRWYISVRLPTGVQFFRWRKNSETFDAAHVLLPVLLVARDELPHRNRRLLL